MAYLETHSWHPGFPSRCFRRRLPLYALLAFAAASAPECAWASYIGDSFISIPGAPGHWQGEHHKNWIRTEANDWPGRLRNIRSGPEGQLTYPGPGGPKPGSQGRLIVTLGVKNPDLARFRDLCAKRTAIPEMVFAESFDRARPPLDLGPKPANVPDYWEYRLKDVVVTGCPMADGAAEQGFVLSFQNVEWLNYDPEGPKTNKIVIQPAELPKVAPAAATARKKVKDYLITWIGLATDSKEDQCPVMNAKPGDADFLRYRSPAEQAAIRARNGEKGITAGSVEAENRGPGGLNAVSLPGVVPDPGFAEPQSGVAYGIDLDGNDGTGATPHGIRKHRNFTAPDGRTGIDNQMYTVMGCVAGFRGKKGYRNQTSNARRADGNFTTLVEVSGIDDEHNDSDIDVALIYSMDKPMRDNAGKTFIPDYTFRTTDDPQFALYNRRVKGRIVNGVIETRAVAKLEVNLGQDPLLELHHAQMRFEPQPDGSVKGYLAGYEDWKKLAMTRASGYSEGLFGYQMPGLFYALKRNADGMLDPATGEYGGISVVYEIDTVPAFLTPAAPAAAQQQSASRKSR